MVDPPRKASSLPHEPEHGADLCHVEQHGETKRHTSQRPSLVVVRTGESEEEDEEMLLRLERIYALYVSLHYRSTVTNDQLSKYNHYFSSILPFFFYFLSLSHSSVDRRLEATSTISISTLNSLPLVLALSRVPLGRKDREQGFDVTRTSHLVSLHSEDCSRRRAPRSDLVHGLLPQGELE